MRIDRDVMEVLGRADSEGHSLKLTGQLERPLYVKTNKVLEALGGKWNRKAGVHIFPCDAGEAVENILLAGEITLPKDMGYFQTQPEMVGRIVGLANIEAGMTILEPSAGGGAIAVALATLVGKANVTCIELDPGRCGALLAMGFSAIQANFLEIVPGPAYDRVVMNPPFSKQEDLRHILHAMSFLRPGGRLVGIMSAGVQFRQNSASRLFREKVAAHGGTIEENPHGAFKASGTMVNTVTVVLERHA